MQTDLCRKAFLAVAAGALVLLSGCASDSMSLKSAIDKAQQTADQALAKANANTTTANNAATMAQQANEKADRALAEAAAANEKVDRAFKKSMMK
ncbi:hypothetical protein JHS3_20730 [Jeongeupia sp. HS-3]|nr:hypothetical protein JHS3_20730 [Jeongeupia sp. HS-3]